MSLLEILRKNLTPEQFTAIQDAVGDDFDWDLVPRSRLNKVIRQRNQLREQLAGGSQPQNSGSAGKDEDDDDQGAAGAATDTKGGQLVDIKALEKQWQIKQDQAVRDVKIQFAALDKLRAANAIDAELLWNGGLVDKTKLDLDANGALIGMDDIITELQKNKAHLFKTAGNGKDGAPAGTGKDGGDPFKGVTTKEEFLKLDADKQIAFKQANPALFKQFLQG